MVYRKMSKLALRNRLVFCSKVPKKKWSISSRQIFASGDHRSRTKERYAACIPLTDPDRLLTRRKGIFVNGETIKLKAKKIK